MRIVGVYIYILPWVMYIFILTALHKLLIIISQEHGERQLLLPFPALHALQPTHHMSCWFCDIDIRSNVQAFLSRYTNCIAHNDDECDECNEAVPLHYVRCATVYTYLLPVEHTSHFKSPAPS